ncbi:putative Cell growth-regulating nucleolar protein [Septoria linicola]|nr:putative Cell growth-regulating nucleolar protein [Septoria linicola]
MVSFSCEGCGDVLTKKKLSGHYNQCWAPVTCLDCMTTFPNGSFQSHTSCMSEAQKYQGHLYRDKDKKNNKGDKRKSLNGGSQAMIPRGAYVESVVDGGDDTNAVAVIDVPPRAPTPPPAAEPPAELEGVNVFDFLVSDATPKAVQLGALDERKMLGHSTPHGNGAQSQYSQYSQYSNGDGSQYQQYGYSYGHAPLPAGMERYDSYNNLTESQQSFVTPAPKDQRKQKKDRGTVEKSERKRKRNVEELDLSSAKRPVSRGDHSMLDAPPSTGGRNLHSGLTGGLQRLVTDPEFYEDDRIDAGPTPISPIKRSKREKEPDDRKSMKDDRRKSSYVSYGTTTKASSSKDDRRQRSRSPERTRRSEKYERSDRHDKLRRTHRDESVSSVDRSHVSSRRSKAIEYSDRPGSVQPSANNAMVAYSDRADMFMSFITKGPDSQHGLSMNKVLKRYHRERDVLRSDEKEEEDKELWKALRLRRNSRGEIVLFM